MQEIHIESLGQEDPLEEEMVTHSRIIAREELSWWSSGKESAFNVGDAGSIPDQRTKILWDRGQKVLAIGPTKELPPILNRYLSIK